MKSIYVIVLITFFYSLVCFSQTKEKIVLVGTEWECEITKDCVNVYKFLTDTTFEFYSCEMEETYYGEFYFENNFLMIYEKGSYEQSDDNYEQKLYKVCVKDDYLKHLVLSYKENGKWVNSKLLFDDTYKYLKKK